MSSLHFAENNNGMPVATGSRLMPSTPSHSSLPSDNEVLNHKEAPAVRVSTASGLIDNVSYQFVARKNLLRMLGKKYECIKPELTLDELCDVCLYIDTYNFVKHVQKPCFECEHGAFVFQEFSTYALAVLNHAKTNSSDRIERLLFQYFTRHTPDKYYLMRVEMESSNQVDDEIKKAFAEAIIQPTTAQPRPQPIWDYSPNRIQPALIRSDPVWQFAEARIEPTPMRWIDPNHHLPSVKELEETIFELKILIALERVNEFIDYFLRTFSIISMFGAFCYVAYHCYQVQWLIMNFVVAFVAWHATAFVIRLRIPWRLPLQIMGLYILYQTLFGWNITPLKVRIFQVSYLTILGLFLNGRRYFNFVLNAIMVARRARFHQMYRNIVMESNNECNMFMDDGLIHSDSDSEPEDIPRQPRDEPPPLTPLPVLPQQELSYFQSIMSGLINGPAAVVGEAMSSYFGWFFLSIGCLIGLIVGLVIRMYNFIVHANQTYHVVKQTIEVAGVVHTIANTPVGISISDLYDEWSNIIKNPKSEAAKDKKITMMNLKTVCHILYHGYNGNNFGVLEWASNFFILCPEDAIKLAKQATDGIAGYMKAEPSVDYKRDGKTYHVTPRMFNAMCSEYAKTGVLPDPGDAYLADIQTEGFEVSAMISTIFGLLKIENMSDQDVRRANQNFTLLHHYRKSSSEVMNFVFAGISCVTRYFHFDPFDEEWQNFVVKVLKTIQKMDDIITKEQADRARLTYIDATMELYDEVTMLRKDPLMDKISSNLQRQYMKRYTQLEGYYLEAKAQKFATRKRRTPITIFWVGKGGSGKSSGSLLVADLFQYERYKDHCRKCRELGVEPDPGFAKRFSYDMGHYMNLQDNFLGSGYRGQEYCFVDDMFKSTNEDKKNDEAEHIYHMVNTIPYSMNVAELKDKGNTYFVSNVIMITSNIQFQGTWEQAIFGAGLADEGALKRRMHIVLKRDDPSMPNAKDNTFEVLSCPEVPEMVGKFLNPGQITTLMMTLKARREIAEEQYEYTMDDLEEIMQDAELIENVQPEGFDNIKDHALHSDDKDKSIYIVSESCRLGLYEWYENERYANYYLGLIALLIAVPTLYWIYSLMNPEKSLFEEAAFDDLEPAEMEAKRKPTEYKKGLRSGKPGRKVQKIEGTDWQNAVMEMNDDIFYFAVENRVAKCMVYIAAAAYEDGKILEQGCAIGFHLKDRLFVVPDHFFSHYSGFKKVKYVIKFGKDDQGSKSTKVLFDGPLEYNRKPGCDLVVFKLPIQNCNIPPSIWKYLDDDPTIELPMGTPILLTTVDSRGAPEIRSGTVTSAPYNFSYGHIPDTYVIQEPIGYHMVTDRGDSGSPLIIRGPNDVPIVKGIHVVSCDRNNMRLRLGIPISKQFFSFIKETNVVMEFMDFPLKVEREVPFKMANFYPRRSKIRKTPMFGMYGAPTCIPAHLEPFENEAGEIIQPYNIAAKKLIQDEFTKCDWFPEEILELYRYHYPKVLGSRILTIDEAVSGIPGKYTPINMGTSLGYPWILKYKNGKRELFEYDFDTQTYNIDPSFRAIIEAYDAKLRNGEQIDIIMADCLKAELRPIEKVKQGKTRLFAVGPIHQTILMRMYCLPFFVNMHKTAVTGPSSVGLNVHSQEWTEFFIRMSRTNGSVLSGDYANYDGSVPAELSKLVCTYINEWFDDGPVNARVRELLFEHIYNPTRICGTKIYKVKNGTPSGMAGTAEENTMKQLAMVHTVLVHDFGISLEEYEFAGYGDDGLICTKKEGLRCSDLAPHLKRRFGMTYTHWSKEESDEHDTLLTVRYIGRKFEPEMGLMKAPLDVRTVEEIPYYTQMDAEDSLAITACADSFFRECFHHGKKFYDSHVESFKAKIDEKMPKLKSVIDKMAYPYHHYAVDMYYNEHVVPDEIFNVQMESRDGTSETDGAGNFDRVFREAIPNQVVELGDYAHDAPVEETAIGTEILQAPYRGCQWPMIDLQEFVGREYKVGTVAWTQGSGAGVILETIDFPDVLFVQAFIVRMLNNYKWFRAGIEITININSNPYLYGMLQFLFVADRNRYPTTLITDTTVGSGFPNVVVSAASGNSVTWRIPFINQARMIEIHNYAAASLGSIVVQVLNPLRDSSGAGKNAEFYVTARFIDIEVYGPLTTNSSDDIDFESIVMESREFGNSESRRKGEAGVISKALDSSASAIAAMSFPSSLQTYADVYSVVARGAAHVARKAGLSKPTSVEVGQLSMVNPFAMFNAAHGVETARVAGLDQENRITVDDIYGGVNTDEMRITYVAGTPQMVFSLVATYTSTGLMYVLDTPGLFSNCYADQVKRMFKFWTGSYKYCIAINASIYHSITAVIWLDISGNPAYTDWQASYHKYIDIKGPTIVDFMIPYDYRFMVGQADATTKIKITFLNWAQPSTSLPIDLNVYKAMGSDFEVYTYLDTFFTPQSSNDIDFHKIAYDDDECENITMEFNPRAHFVNEFHKFHPDMTEYKTKNYVIGERVESFREVLHQSAPYYPITTADDMYTFNRVGHTYDDGSGPKQIHMGIEKIGQFYMWWSGGITFKILLANHMTDKVYSMYSTGSDQKVIAGFDATTINKPFLELTCPHFYQEIMRATHQDSNFTVVNNANYLVTNAPNGYVWKNAADDFSMHFLMPFPANSLIQSIYVGNNLIGYPGYLQYLISSAPLTSERALKALPPSEEPSSEEEYSTIRSVSPVSKPSRAFSHSSRSRGQNKKG